MSDTELDRWNIDFGVAKSIRYHAYRRSFWDSFDNFSKIITVLSGAAVILTIVGANHLLATISAAIVAATSTLDVVIGFSSRARVHDGLYRAFSRLAQDIAEKPGATEADLSLWRRRRLEIEMDEPGTIDWLERRCFSEEAVARDAEIPQAVRLKTWQIWLSQWAMWPSIPRGTAG